MSLPAAESRTKTIREIAFEKIRKPSPPSQKPEPNQTPKQELDRGIYARCATTKYPLRFFLSDGSEIYGRALDSSRFCVTVEVDCGCEPPKRRMLYKHAIVSVEYPASENPVVHRKPENEVERREC